MSNMSEVGEKGGTGDKPNGLERPAAAGDSPVGVWNSSVLE